jgi:hypothetical protein
MRSGVCVRARACAYRAADTRAVVIGRAAGSCMTSTRLNSRTTAAGMIPEECADAFVVRVCACRCTRRAVAAARALSIAVAPPIASHDVDAAQSHDDGGWVANQSRFMRRCACVCVRAVVSAA